MVHAGKLGIGTVSPAYNLDVSGNINFTGTLSKWFYFGFTQPTNSYSGLYTESKTYNEDFSGNPSPAPTNFARYTTTFTVSHNFSNTVNASDATIELIYAKFGDSAITPGLDRTQTVIAPYGSSGQSWVIGLHDGTYVKMILLELTLSQSSNTQINVLNDVIQSKYQIIHPIGEHN